MPVAKRFTLEKLKILLKNQSKNKVMFEYLMPKTLTTNPTI